MEKKKRVGIWVRVSTEYQVKDESPEHHERRARMFAEAKEWDVVEVYRLEAISGKTVMEHPQTQRMLRDVRSGHITALIFSKLARLARNTKELLEFSEYFRQENADLISLAEAIDTSSSSGRLFFTIIAAMAEWERAEIAERVAASVPIRAKMGKTLGGAAPFGFRWKGTATDGGKEKDKKLVVDDKEAPIRRLLYELFTQYKRKKAVASELNKRGHRTRNGSKFSDTTVGRLLRDPTAKGIRLANYTKSLGEGKKWIVKPESEWVQLPCPAIVAEDLWEECNCILDQQEQTRKKPVKRAAHLFTGILFCECGSKMHVPSGSKKYVCQSCRKNRIEKDDIEEIYYEHLKSFLMTDEQVENFIAKADYAITEKERQLTTLRTEQKRLEQEMDKTMQLYLAGQIAKENFAKFFNPLDEQFKQIERSIPDTQAEIDFMRMEYLNGDTVITEAKNLYGKWYSIVHEEKRNIVEQITDRITIAGDSIKFKFSYNPAFLRNAPDWQRNLRDS